MKILGNFLVFVSLLTLLGCSVAPKNIADKNEMSKGSGVLVVGLHTDWEGHDNPLLASLNLLYKGINDSSFNYREMTFQGKDHVAVIELPAKTYYFYQMSFGNRYWEIDKKSEFEIKEETVTYIGDITSNVSISGFSAGANLFVQDEFVKSKKYLKKNYVKLISAFPVEKRILELKIQK